MRAPWQGSGVNALTSAKRGLGSHCGARRDGDRRRGARRTLGRAGAIGGDQTGNLRIGRHRAVGERIEAGADAWVPRDLSLHLGRAETAQKGAGLRIERAARRRDRAHEFQAPLAAAALQPREPSAIPCFWVRQGADTAGVTSPLSRIGDGDGLRSIKSRCSHLLHQLNFVFTKPTLADRCGSGAIRWFSRERRSRARHRARGDRSARSPRRSRRGRRRSARRRCWR